MLVMLVICVTYPTATSASSGQRGTDMSQSMKKVHSSLSIALSIFPLHSMYVSIYVTPLALPRSPSCNLHPARVQCNCNYFWFSTLTMGNYIGHFPVYRFTVPDSRYPVPNSQLPLPVTTELFRVLQPNSISIMRGKVLCCGFSVTNCFPIFLPFQN